MLATACPKPERREKEKRRNGLRPAWSEAEWARQLDRMKAAKARAIARQRAKPRKPRKPLPKRNERRAAKRLTAYRKMIASDFQKRLRYEAFCRSGGLCECEQCVAWRRDPRGAAALLPLNEAPFIPIPVWFVRGGAPIWKRFRSQHGELHHLRYSRAEREDPGAIEDVRWCWKECHRRIEASHGTRRAYLRGNR